MTPEQRAWNGLRAILDREGLDPRRVENILGPGHPDIDYTHGNIELKALESFPARPHTKVNIETFTGEQAGWLLQRQRAGGRAWLLVRVSTEWFLFDAEAAYEVYKGATSQRWRELAVWTGTHLSTSAHRLSQILRGQK